MERKFAPLQMKHIFLMRHKNRKSFLWERGKRGVTEGFLPHLDWGLFQKVSWGSSTASEPTSRTSTHRCRGHRPTDIEDIDFEVASAGEERLRREGIGGSSRQWESPVSGE